MTVLHTLELEEGERQALLLALAHLSVERPGWDHMLNEIARRIDNVAGDRAKLYDQFRALRQGEGPRTGGDVFCGQIRDGVRCSSVAAYRYTCETPKPRKKRRKRKARKERGQ